MKRTTILVTIDHNNDQQGDKFYGCAVNALLHGDTELSLMSYRSIHFSHKTIDLVDTPLKTDPNAKDQLLPQR
jgi:hypothetical protein